MDDIHCWQDKLVICSYAQDLLDKLIEVNSYAKYPVDIEQVKKGIYYAKKYHGDQMRQSGEPYYTHPIAVASMVAEYTAFEMPKFFRTDMIITALLHDTIEDTELTEAMIAKIFDEKIAGQVENLTRIKRYGKISSGEMVKILYAERKIDALLIKLFDRVHNMQTIGAKSHEKIHKIKNETLQYFIILAEYLSLPSVSKLIHALVINSSTKIHISRPNFSQDNYQLLSLIYQNALHQKYNL